MTKSQRTMPNKKPLQKRSRERWEQILQTARQLIQEGGLQSLTLNAIAARADISVGSVYQYFPSKEAVIRTLAVEHLEQLRTRLRKVILQAPLEDLVEEQELQEVAVAQMRKIIRVYEKFYRSDPTFEEIWNGMHSSQELYQLDIEDSRSNAQLIYNSLKEIVPEQNLSRLESVAFLICDVTGSSLRLALRLQKQQAKLHRLELERLLEAYLRSLWQ